MALFALLLDKLNPCKFLKLLQKKWSNLLQVSIGLQPGRATRVAGPGWRSEVTSPVIAHAQYMRVWCTRQRKIIIFEIQKYSCATRTLSYFLGYFSWFFGIKNYFIIIYLFYLYTDLTVFNSRKFIMCFLSVYAQYVNFSGFYVTV